MRGLLPQALVIDPPAPTDLFGGSSQSLETKYGAAVINPSGDWSDYVPTTENQDTSDGDTFACTNFGTSNAVEILARFNFKETINLSDRFFAKESGTKPGYGNSPKTVADYLRHGWSVKENEWPDVDTVEEFYAEVPSNLKTVAVARGAEFEFGYQYITNSLQSIKTALQSSPVCIAVTAWQQVNGVYTRIQGIAENHWTTIIKVLDNGNYQVFDSFPPFIKEVSPDACKSVAMSYYLDRQVVVESAWTRFIKTILALFKATPTPPVKPRETPQDAPKPPQPTPPTVPTVPPAPEPQKPKYDWSSEVAVRHSVRVICDEEGLVLGLKNDMCATIQAESGGHFNTKAVNRNYYASGPRKGQLASTDWGLCQWNDYYHGKEMPPDVAMNDPEKAVRLMAHYWKLGEQYRTWWIAYANGLYKKYL